VIGEHRTNRLGASSLAYVGGRPYIRGADLFALFDELIRSEKRDLAPRLIDRFRLVREVRRDGAWYLGQTDDASATIEFADPGGERRTAAFVEEGAEITAQRPDIASVVSDVALSGDFAGRARLKPLVRRRDLIDGLIEVNKTLHAQTLTARGVPADTIRLIYIESLPVIDVDPRDAGRDVEIHHLGARTAERRTYTLNTAQLADLDGRPFAPVSICYSF
jgi:hypothetical protein